MFEDENEGVETQEETQEEVELEEVESSTEDAEEENVDWKAKALEEEALRKKEEERRKKAEETIEKAKKKSKTAPSVATNGLSTVDIIALTRANIEEEDIDDVLDWAKFKKISIPEALKSTALKATLSEKAEERKSAQAVYTGSGTRRAGGSISDERLMADAQKGIMPDSEADLARLTILRMKNR